VLSIIRPPIPRPHAERRTETPNSPACRCRAAFAGRERQHADERIVDLTENEETAWGAFALANEGALVGFRVPELARSEADEVGLAARGFGERDLRVSHHRAPLRG
jgi:hypothetical protein